MALSAVPDPSSNNSSLYVIPVAILLVLALVLFILRIYTRLTRTKQLYLDDWLIIAAEPLSVANACLGFAAVGYGWGHQYLTISPTNITHILKLQFAVQTTWIITLCLVRVSVACSLLRFGTDRPWRWTLYGLMTLQCLISSSYIVIQFGQCRPVSSNWQSVPNVKCWPVNPIIDYGWAIAGVYVTMDLILSLMPIRLVRTLHRSTSEKILICALMAMGLAATGVACGKMTTFNSFGSGDPMQATIAPSMYAKLEELVGIIASCCPCLKAPAEGALKKFGILKEHQLTRPSFVMSLPDVSKEPDQRSSGEASDPTGKRDIRIDSVSVAPGSSSSNKENKKATSARKEPWDVV